VDSAFADYLQRFENEAATRGRHFDLDNTGLIIEFGNLKDGYAGLTHYENPIRIEIDKKYWNAISNYAGADLMKEDLLFHELGHGLLGRSHLNSTLENGDWKSIMCGGDKVNDRAWNINYKGERRKYYLDELFDESTLQPAFASNQLAADTVGYSPKITLNFNSTNQTNFGWSLVDDVQHKISSDNGQLRFESKVALSYLVYLRTPIDVQTDFAFEMTLEYSSTDESNQYGMVFGNHIDSAKISNEEIEYFTINNNRHMYMGNRSWYSFFTELTENQIVPGGKNKLKVFKSGKMLYYFINNVYSYCSEMETQTSGYYFGFMVPPLGVVFVDDLSIAKHSSSGVAARVTSLQSLEFECTPVELTNQREIKKQ